MKATFALLTDQTAHNVVRSLTWRMFQEHRVSLDACRLPPHVSLKQPFDVPDAESLDAFMHEFAREIVPFEVRLTQLELMETGDGDYAAAILWIAVQETQVLRNLHDRLNAEVTSRFNSPPAPFDGADYHFHLTLATGGNALRPCRRAFEAYQTEIVDLRFQVNELAMFVYDDRANPAWDYMTYQIVPLGHPEIR